MDSNDSEAGNLGKSYIKNMFIFSSGAYSPLVLFYYAGERSSTAYHRRGVENYVRWINDTNGGINLFLQTGCVIIFRLLKSQLQKSS